MRQGLTASSTHESQGAFPGQPSAGHRASETYPEFLLMKRRAASSKVADLPRCVHRVAVGPCHKPCLPSGACQGQTEPVTRRPDLRLHLEVLADPGDGGDFKGEPRPVVRHASTRSPFERGTERRQKSAQKPRKCGKEIKPFGKIFSSAN